MNLLLGRKKIKLMFGILILVVGVVLYLVSTSMKRRALMLEEDFDLHLRSKDKEVYLVNNSGCRIPKLNPFHTSVKGLVKRLPDLNCGPPSLLVLENTTIRMNATSSDNVSCFVQSMSRKTDDLTVLSNKTRVENGSVNISEEFVKVACSRDVENETIVYTQFYPFIIRKPDVDRRIKNYMQQSNRTQRDETFRILMLGLDSVSKNQFLRHMLKTYEFIKNNLTYVELFGYNKVGKNTYQNVVALLTGKMDYELNYTSKPKMYADTLPLIWLEYMKHGYKTMFSEDFPPGSIFNFARKGFQKPPADYYLRPWSLSVEPYIKKYKQGCLEDRIEANVILKWLEDFFNFFPNDPLFAFTFLTRMSHDYINGLSYHDKPVHDLLLRLYQKDHLNNTIVFFFGDHGYRYGSMRATYIGRMEGRLPFMFLLLPSWFPQKYPEIYKNLKANERRLTTPLDIYATLQDLLYFRRKYGSGSLDDGRSINLLRMRVPPERTCTEANIKSQWCACLNLEPVPLHDICVINSAKSIIKKINSITAVNRTRCAEVSLLKVLNASKHVVELGEESPHDGYTNYLLNILVLPSYAMFEGSVWFNGKKTYSVDDIERINLYGNQSFCIDINLLKPYCYCKKVVNN